ncbi:MAG: ATP-dependent Clp protease ATP-binding subunit [Cytophagales bacterium]|nr:ATP-dependent Clp protease ATP-binding subunit [Armatimonadota bacterium]
MWTRFTDRTRRAIFRAQQAASDRSENLVKPEHLLMGLLAETDTTAFQTLSEAGIAPGDLVWHLESILTPGPGRDDTPLRLDPAAKRALELAANEAWQQNRYFIGTEHLLIGLVGEGSGATGITFRYFGLSADRLRAVLVVPLEPSPLPRDSAAGGEPGPVALRYADSGNVEKPDRNLLTEFLLVMSALLLLALLILLLGILSGSRRQRGPVSPESIREV